MGCTSSTAVSVPVPQQKCILPINLTKCGSYGCILDQTNVFNQENILDLVFSKENTITLYDISGAIYTSKNSNFNNIIDVHFSILN